MALSDVIVSLLVLYATAATSDGARSCRYSAHFSAAGGNMSCPDAAPVLSSLRATVPPQTEGINHRSQPTTNWTMTCDCPGWSLLAADDSNITSEWRPFNDSFRATGFSIFVCALNQYLSGLAYQFSGSLVEDSYSWWGRCSNMSRGYILLEDICWRSGAPLTHGRNGSVTLPSRMIVLHRVEIKYLGYEFSFNNIRKNWTYFFCEVQDVECLNPHIPNGYSDLSLNVADYQVGKLSKHYNDTLQLYCRQGFYMEGPNVSRCQANREWTQLPTCRPCKPIRNCKILNCRDGASSICLTCKPYTSTGLKLALNHNRRKCRIVPYINRTLVDFLFVYEPGDTIRMDCPAVGTPRPSIEWFSRTHNQSVDDLINSTRLHYFPNGSLEISDLAPEDEALYRCAAVNSVGLDMVYILVINLEAYRFYRTPAAPVINQTTTILFFKTNERAVLHCRTSGTPPPRVQWYKLDYDRQYTVPSYGILRMHTHDNGSLAFYPILHEDWGRYACEAVNDYGHDVAMWLVCVGDSCGGTPSGGIDLPPPHLFIEYSPIIVRWTKVHIVSEGHSLSVPCVAGGNPPPSIEWRRDNSIISDDATLTLKQVSVNDTGIYRCMARSRAGVARREMVVIVEKIPLTTSPINSMPPVIVISLATPTYFISLTVYRTLLLISFVWGLFIYLVC